MLNGVQVNVFIIGSTVQCAKKFIWQVRYSFPHSHTYYVISQHSRNSFSFMSPIVSLFQIVWKRFHFRVYNSWIGLKIKCVFWYWIFCINWPDWFASLSISKLSVAWEKVSLNVGCGREKGKLCFLLTEGQQSSWAWICRPRQNFLCSPVSFISFPWNLKMQL